MAFCPEGLYRQKSPKDYQVLLSEDKNKCGGLRLFKIYFCGFHVKKKNGQLLGHRREVYTKRMCCYEVEQMQFIVLYLIALLVFSWRLDLVCPNLEFHQHL